MSRRLGSGLLTASALIAALTSSEVALSQTGAAGATSAAAAAVGETGWARRAAGVGGGARHPDR